ncbi:hypothetical protein DA096_07655 [Vibrio rotiferianus]|uniref:hypothetical protein n=1 Tax=Vibrio rotiferianus TaxID=190895 RepID=UPI0011101640|nr:hypothetical protein [Vibrio rotiferianus]TMX35299.1 hypothetical protein DA095_14680 [Vibrio rotiferianus]TMX57161.1 hypothetical protein DA093_06310 [Vibrio rotiferianus]TMX67082.1 hypothetical protein DA096_07655 [Vibrio rotiferianus]
MKELSMEEISLVVGGSAEDKINIARKFASFIKNRNPVGLMTHSEKLNVGEDEYLRNMREQQNRERGRHGHNERHGNYRRGDGGREIER